MDTLLLFLRVVKLFSTLSNTVKCHEYPPIIYRSTQIIFTFGILQQVEMNNLER